MIATPYNKWWDPPPPIFFVDDDTQMYTVSKDPLQICIDSVSGAVKYTKVGWLPPSTISLGFYHQGTNPLQKVHDAPGILTWPSTKGVSPQYGWWWICSLGYTGQCQIYVNDYNFDSQGVERDPAYCHPFPLSALNANPWKKPPHHGGHGYDDDNHHGGYDDGHGGH